MVLTEITSIPSGALPFYSLKNHLRMGTGFTEDDLQDPLLEAYLRVSLSTIENKLGLAIIERNFSWNLTGWRDAARQNLPMRSVSEIVTVTTNSESGGSALQSPNSYRLQKDVQSPAIVATSSSLPGIPVDGTVDIVFKAGYGSVWESIPTDLGQAVLILAAWFYENRTGDPHSSGVLPVAVTALIEPYRVIRISGNKR
jgi:uncharacterized phiE125 gp8 family phage protein